MGYQKKVIITVLVIIGIMIFLARWMPNQEVSGNKNIIPQTAMNANSDHSEEKTGDATEKEESAAVAPTTDAATRPNFEFTFTAFKTPQKAPVAGTFTAIELDNVKNGPSISESLTGSTFMIPTSSINTNDPSGTRDAKLKEFFFDNLQGATINGEFKSFENGKAIVSITMNGTTKDVPMTYTESDNALELKGKIDIVDDFKANKALDAIAEACKDLHANKTWSEVDLNVKFTK